MESPPGLNYIPLPAVDPKTEPQFAAESRPEKRIFTKKALIQSKNHLFSTDNEPLTHLGGSPRLKL